MNVKVCSSLSANHYDCDFSIELRLKDGEDENFELGLRNGKDDLRDFIRENEVDELCLKSLKREELQNPKYECWREDKGGLKSEGLIGIEMGGVRN